MACLIPIQFALGWFAEHVANEAGGIRVLGWHYQLGMVLVGLLVLRIAVRALSRLPDPVAGEPLWRRRTAASVHVLLYLLLVLLPATGYVIWVWMEAPMDVFGAFDLPRLFTQPAEDETLRAWSWYAHVWGGWLLAALVMLHVGAALWHRPVRDEGLMRRRMT